MGISLRTLIMMCESDLVIGIYKTQEEFRSFNKAPPEEMYADMTRYRHMIKDGRHSMRLLKPKSAVYFTYRVA